jgi:hypothetical protein
MARKKAGNLSTLEKERAAREIGGGEGMRTDHGMVPRAGTIFGTSPTLHV